MAASPSPNGFVDGENPMSAWMRCRIASRSSYGARLDGDSGPPHPIEAMKSLLAILSVACFSPGAWAAETSVSPEPQPLSMNVGLCGTQPSTSGDLGKAIERFRDRMGNDQSILAFLKAQETARLKINRAQGVLIIEGSLRATTAAAFDAVMKRHPEIEHIVINSFGGSARAALHVAEQVRARRMTLTVRGFCMSACSGYLLPAARAVHLHDAVIGFHGSAAECHQRLSAWQGVSEWGLSNYLEFRRVVELEQRFAVPAELSKVKALSQRPDRGGMDGEIRDWLIVSPERLKALGIHVAEIQSTASFEAIQADQNDSILGPIHVF